MLRAHIHLGSLYGLVLLRPLSSLPGFGQILEFFATFRLVNHLAGFVSRRIEREKAAKDIFKQRAPERFSAVAEDGHRRLFFRSDAWEGDHIFRSFAHLMRFKVQHRENEPDLANAQIASSQTQWLC